MARNVLRIAFASAICALAFTGGTARADLLPGLLGGNCGATSDVFAPWGDGSAYYFASNGGFESGSTGWSLSSGAQIVSGNEPFYVHARGDSRSLLLPSGGTAAINACYGLTYPAVRFFASSATNSNATIRVRIVARSLLGVLSVLDGGTFTVGPNWGPGAKLSTLFSAVAAPVGTKSMQVQLIASNGAVRVDDLYVDPFLQGE